MRRLLTGAVLILGSVSAMQAQEVTGAGAGQQPAASSNMATSPEVRFAPNAPLVAQVAAPLVPVRSAGDLLDANFASAPTASTSETVASNTDIAVPGPVPSAALSGDPEPAPDPKFLYGGRDDYRWQLGLGLSWERFNSSIFNASAVGLNTSISYYLNNWLGVEGNVMTGFAPEIFDREHVKLLNFTGGPRIAWRQRRWEPWVHGLIGLAHEQPQTAGNSRNTFAVQAGGGADFRLNPRLSFRLQGDWIHTLFFGQSQNNFALVGGVVIHF